MKKVSQILTLSLASFALIFLGCERFAPVENTSITFEQYIVELNFGKSDIPLSTNEISDRIKKFIEASSIPSERVVYIYTRAIVGFSAYLSEEEIEVLSKNPYVKLIEKDQIVSLPPFEVIPDNPKSNQIQSQTTPWGISAIGGFVNGSNLSNVAWILDTGIDLDHPDLNVNTNRSRTFVRTGRDSRTADDLNGHGTHVAGTIAARNNSIGVVGVVAGAQVIAIKVLSSNGSGSISDIVAGLDHVANYGSAGDVANLSLGGSTSTTLDNAVTNTASYGIYVVIAAGNSSANANNYSPARVNGTRIYTISAHNNNNVFASFSNYGNPPIDYCAPGVSVYSTYKDGRYATMSGTSMATPHVSGIILANSGTIYTRGYVSNDPDNNADPLASRTQ
ncbi:MAG: S8 family serine peptidase [Ignavibacteria bacterium]|nr:S8 family serine peptidase [Ignavibacteria bacterium]